MESKMKSQSSNKQGRAGAVLLLFALLGAVAIYNSGGKAKQNEAARQNITNAAPAPVARQDITSDLAAEVGSEVSIRYPSSTFICEDRLEAGQVSLVGKMVVSDALRMGESAHKALTKGNDAQKEAVRRRYSCEVPRSGTRYVVVQKEITGTPSDTFHTADYCLRPIGTSQPCLWLIRDVKYYTPFENVKIEQH
jgi:hypothetical protein